MKRREYLASVGLGLLSTGCLGNSTSSQPPTDRSDETNTIQSTAAPASQSPEWSPTQRGDTNPQATTTGNDEPNARDFLPPSTDGWELTETDHHHWGALGGTDGIRGHYRGPDVNEYQLIVMFRNSNTEGVAEAWSCAGWQIALAVDGVAIAASTGTDQREFTPEKPPTMTRTPVPETKASVRELLLHSPHLTESALEENTVTRDC